MQTHLKVQNHYIENWINKLLFFLIPINSMEYHFLCPIISIKPDTPTEIRDQYLAYAETAFIDITYVF